MSTMTRVLSYYLIYQRWVQVSSTALATHFSFSIESKSIVLWSWQPMSVCLSGNPFQVYRQHTDLVSDDRSKSSGLGSFQRIVPSRIKERHVRVRGVSSWISWHSSTCLLRDNNLLVSYYLFFFIFGCLSSHQTWTETCWFDIHV